MQAAYLPELHDLAPPMADRLDRLINTFPAAARPHVAHLVVPDWQGRAPLHEAPAFAARLRKAPGNLVLHGLTHSLGPDFLNWLIHGHDNRSEFARLDARQTRDRLARATQLAMSGLGEVPGWFCAPRWQGNPHLDAALQETGFHGVMEAGALHRFGHGRLPLPVLNFDNGARLLTIWPGLCARAVSIRQILRARRPFRLVLHPDDLDRPAVIAQFRRLCARLEAEGWQPLSLDAMLASLANTMPAR